MKPLSLIANSMRDDWDRRVEHDYRFWIANEISSQSLIWEEGERDFSQIISGIDLNHRDLALEIGCGVGRMLPAANKPALIHI